MSTDTRLNARGANSLLQGECSVFLADERDTELFGQLLAQASQTKRELTSAHATIGGRIFLSGELGAGKTTMTRGLVKAYGHEGAVKSPTYTLVEPYEFALANIYHFDLYRLSDPEEVEFLGVEDYFAPENLCVIEWAEKGQGFLPHPDLAIEITIEGQGRRACWQYSGDKGELVSRALTELCQKSKLGTQFNA